MLSFRLLCVGVFFGFACGGSQHENAALSCPESETPPEAAQAITPADLAPLMMEPERLIAMVDNEQGVTVVRQLSCEREDVHNTQHACGDATEVLTPLLSTLQNRIRQSILFDEEGGITCVGTGSVECVVPPHNECESTFQLLFSGSVLTVVIERDDWQSHVEITEANDREIRAFLTRESRCSRAAP